MFVFFAPNTENPITKGGQSRHHRRVLRRDRNRDGCETHSMNKLVPHHGRRIRVQKKRRPWVVNAPSCDQSIFVINFLNDFIFPAYENIAFSTGQLYTGYSHMTVCVICV